MITMLLWILGAILLVLLIRFLWRVFLRILLPLIIVVVLAGMVAILWFWFAQQPKSFSGSSQTAPLTTSKLMFSSNQTAVLTTSNLTASSSQTAALTTSNQSIFALSTNVMLSVEISPSLVVIDHVVGLGATQEDAIKVAQIEAVHSAVGTYLDATTIVQNENVIRDQILAYSAGFIREYSVIDGPSHTGGVYRVVIKATVERSKLEGSMRDNKIIFTTSLKGANLAAETTTRLSEMTDALALLQETFVGFPANVMRARTTGMKVYSLGKTNAIYTFNVKVDVDMAAYSKFTGKVKRICGLIARGQYAYRLIFEPFIFGRDEERKEYEQYKKELHYPAIYQIWQVGGWDYGRVKRNLEVCEKSDPQMATRQAQKIVYDRQIRDVNKPLQQLTKFWEKYDAQCFPLTLVVGYNEAKGQMDLITYAIPSFILNNITQLKENESWSRDEIKELNYPRNKPGYSHQLLLVSLHDNSGHVIFDTKLMLHPGFIRKSMNDETLKSQFTQLDRLSNWNPYDDEWCYSPIHRADIGSQLFERTKQSFCIAPWFGWIVLGNRNLNNSGWRDETLAKFVEYVYFPVYLSIPVSLVKEISTISCRIVDRKVMQQPDTGDTK